MHMHRTAAAVLLLVGGAMAQAPGLERMFRWLPAPGPCLLTVVGDVNGDGRADVVQGPFRSAGDVWLGGADASLQRLPQAMPYFAELARALVLADFDGDGDLDVAMVNELPIYGQSPVGMLRVLHNDGTGRFTAAVPGINMGYGSASPLLAAGDLDADGDRDLVVYRRVWRNDGTGIFSLGSIELTRPFAQDLTNALTLADLDGDGDVDAYVSNMYQAAWTPTSPPFSEDRVFRNDGQGVLTEVASPGVVVGNATLDTRAHDFDQDGDLDLLQLTRANPTGTFTYAWRLLRNDGALAFTQVWWQALAAGTRIDVADWNGDGRADVAVYDGPTLVGFTQATTLQFVPANLPAAVAVAPVLFDIDQDFDTDCIVPSTDGFTEHRLLRNVGGAWAVAPLTPTVSVPQQWAMDMADVNGDGVPDIVWGSSSTDTGRILLGDGNGGFTPAAAGAFGQYLAHTADIECADVDGDGDPDILVGAYQAPVVNPPTSRLFRNVNGNFVVVPFPSVYGSVVRLRDLDGDADLDAVLVGYGTITVATNDGTGAFTAVAGSVPFNAYDPRFVHVGDFDGDADPDLLLEYGSSGSGTHLFRNVGNALFQHVATTLPFGLQCAADLDGDGDVDLLGASAVGAPMWLHRNSGTGSFVTQPFPALLGVNQQGLVRKILPEDLDQDGRVDLVVADHAGQWQGQALSSILWNQGGLTFTAGPFEDLPYAGFPSGFADIDLDGDRDLVLLGWQPQFLRSIHRHLALRTLPRIGHTLDLDVRGRAAEPYVLAFALARTWLPIPGLGTLQLDPASLQVAALGAYDAAGLAPFSPAVPHAPSLVGLRLHWQALSGAVPQLGNLLTTELQAR